MDFILLSYLGYRLAYFGSLFFCTLSFTRELYTTISELEYVTVSTIGMASNKGYGVLVFYQPSYVHNSRGPLTVQHIQTLTSWQEYISYSHT